MTKHIGAATLCLAFVIAGCTSNLTNPDAQPPPAAPGGCPGTAKAAEAPAEHRTTAAACTPTRNPFADGGVASCSSNADCASDGSSAAFSTCLHGSCTIDQCLTDGDCGSSEVCACSSDYYGGVGAFHGNVCVPGNCHVDRDCGAGGYCSPSRGHCGSFQGFYCHTPKDSCLDGTKDCGTCGNQCVYAPTTATFICGSVICGG